MRRFRAVAAALFSILLLLLAAASAYAEPTLHVTEPDAKAGQIVHFSISDAERGERYVLEIGGQEVAREKTRGRHGLSGEFTMPDLGDVTRVVMLAARTSGHGPDDDDDDDDDDESALTRGFLYVAPVAPTEQVGVQPVVALGASPSPETAPALPTPLATTPPTSNAPTGVPARKRSSRHTRGARKRAHPRSDAERSGHRRIKRKERQRNAGVLRHVLGSGGAAEPLSTDGSTNGSANTPRATPRATITPSSQVVDAGEGGISIALLVPALLALAALALATVAVLRRRRDPRSSGDE